MEIWSASSACWMRVRRVVVSLAASDVGPGGVVVVGAGQVLGSRHIG